MPGDLPAVSRRPRRRWWGFFTQFSLRTLLLIVTAASVACWWFLRPQVREEQFEGTSLRLRSQVRLVKYVPRTPQPEYRGVVNARDDINGQPYQIINSGHWRLFDQRHNLLVDGHYKN